MEKRYPADFLRVRPWGSEGDRKNDGYLRSERILFQCYAPNNMHSARQLPKNCYSYQKAMRRCAQRAEREQNRVTLVG